MNEQKLRGLLGLCVRARVATFGMDGCIKAIRNQSCALVLVDKTASAQTLDKISSGCQHHHIPLYYLPEGMLADATGRSGIITALSPSGLTNQILTLLPNDKEEILFGGASVE